jgi:hypothetical protein
MNHGKRAGMNHLTQPVDLRKTMLCGGCGKHGRPLPRSWGLPTEWAIRKARNGRLVLMGCTRDREAARFECRHCGMDTYVERRLGVEPLMRLRKKLPAARRTDIPTDTVHSE